MKLSNFLSKIKSLFKRCRKEQKQVKPQPVTRPVPLYNSISSFCLDRLFRVPKLSKRQQRRKRLGYPKKTITQLDSYDLDILFLQGVFIQDFIKMNKSNWNTKLFLRPTYNSSVLYKRFSNDICTEIYNHNSFSFSLKACPSPSKTFLNDICKI